MALIPKEQLIKLQATLKSDAAIAAKFGISRQAVHMQRVKYGIKANLTKNKDRNEKIRGLYKNGKTGIEIADRLGLSRSQVYRLIKRK